MRSYYTYYKNIFYFSLLSFLTSYVTMLITNALYNDFT